MYNSDAYYQIQRVVKIPMVLVFTKVVKLTIFQELRVKVLPTYV